MKYKFIDEITSDVMFEAYGKTLEELLVNSATAMFELICQIDKIKPEKSIKVEFLSNFKDLIYDWLSNLLTGSEVAGLFLSKFEVKVKEENGKYHVKAECFGEQISKEKGGTVVKAVTYYKYKVEKTPEGYKTRVSFDI